MTKEKFGIGDIMRQAREPEAQPTSKPDDQIPAKPENQPTREPVNQEAVNLCVKVPKAWRKHWAVQAKIQDLTMTQIMVDALIEKFGLPDDQKTR